MKRPQDEFWHSRFSQVSTMIDMYADEQQMIAARMNNQSYTSKYFEQTEEVKEIKSMKEIEGW